MNAIKYFQVLFRTQLTRHSVKHKQPREVLHTTSRSYREDL